MVVQLMLTGWVWASSFLLPLYLYIRTYTFVGLYNTVKKHLLM